MHRTSEISTHPSRSVEIKIEKGGLLPIKTKTGRLLGYGKVTLPSKIS